MKPVYLKRLHKEIELFVNKEKFNKYNINIQKFFTNLHIKEYYINDNNKDNKDNIFLDFKDNNDKLLLTIAVPNSYPFKSYILIFNNITNKLNNKNSYFKNIGLLSENKIYDKKILAFFYKLQYGLESKFLNLNSNDCFCCNSLFCNHNWNPSLTFENILLEYLEIQFIVKYSKPYNYINILNIYNKLFHKYLNKMPLELLDKILL
jgi:ubiquitin-protein ligase